MKLKDAIFSYFDSLIGTHTSNISYFLTIFKRLSSIWIFQFSVHFVSLICIISFFDNKWTCSRICSSVTFSVANKVVRMVTFIVFSEPFFLIKNMSTRNRLKNYKYKIWCCWMFRLCSNPQNRKKKKNSQRPSLSFYFLPAPSIYVESQSLFSFPASLIHSDFMFKLGKCSPLFLLF